MHLQAWHNEKEAPDERVALDPLISSSESLLKAIDCEGVSEKISEILARMSGDGFEQSCLDELIEELDKLVEEVISQNGKIEIRYVGDLKPSKYDLHARFYHLTQHSTDEDLRKIIRDLITQGRKEINLINLANVRDANIKIGNQEVANLESELLVVSEALERFKAWDKAGFWAKVEG